MPIRRGEAAINYARLQTYPTLATFAERRKPTKKGKAPMNKGIHGLVCLFVLGTAFAWGQPSYNSDLRTRGKDILI